MTDETVVSNLLTDHTQQELVEMLNQWTKPWFNNPYKRQIIRCIRKAISQAKKTGEKQ